VRPISRGRAALASSPEGRQIQLEARRTLGRALEVAPGPLRLTALRLKAGLTQVELADLSGIAQPHISRLENGHTTPEIGTLQRLADVLGVPVETLVAAFTSRTA
jgi:DNA-binding XRE family transcriptional regulator